jgi:hypothetical protein
LADPTRGGGDAAEEPPRSVEDQAREVMRRVSRDDVSYAFGERAVADIERKLEDRRGSTELRAALLSIQRGADAIASRARNEGLEPRFVVYAALALTDGGRDGRDPSAVAHSTVEDLAELNKTFGGGGAEGSLLVIAAYSEGVGSKRSHPLLDRMRGPVGAPNSERNVWFLHERGVIGERAYDLAVGFIAFGIVAQNPRQFGIEADPLAF